MQTKNRLHLLDQIRGFAVVLMIIFHLGWDLNQFGFVKIDFQNDFLWWIFPRVIVTLFLFAVGSSLFIVHSKQIKWNGFIKRFAQLSVFAALISIFTYFAFPRNWIYFGTLHCIAVCSFLALPFVRYPLFSLITGVTLFIVEFILKIDLPWFDLPHNSMDYIPALPWIMVVFFGIYFTSIGIYRFQGLPSSKTTKYLEILGRKSLYIYLLHQPILFGLTYLAYTLVNL